MSEINDAYKAGTYTLDEAKKIAADEVRQMRYGEAGYFWIDQSDGTNVVRLEVIPREQTVWKPRMQKDTRW